MRSRICLVCLGFLVLGCKSSSVAPSMAKTALFKTAIEKQHYRIVSNWARPQLTNAFQQVANSGLLPPGSTPNSISLIGNSNYLTVSGDSISSYLPYFGERQMQVAYNGSDSAIKFEGTMEDYSIVKNKKSGYTIKFNAKSNSESFKVIINLYPNAKARIDLNGSSRFPITYTGELKVIDSL